VKVLGKGIAMVNGSAAPTKVNNTDFEGVVNGTTKANEFTITNKGTTTLTSIDIIGADAASFSITGIDLSSPVTLVNDDSKKFSIVFNPALYAAGVKKAMIQINYADACYPIEFEVQGTALICSPGTFAAFSEDLKIAPSNVTTPSASLDIAQGDFNEDGNQDLATVFLSNGVHISLGDGDGGFASSTEVPLVIGNFYANSYREKGEYFKMKVGDFNGDGHLDLALPTFDSKITLLYGNGQGEFPDKKDITLLRADADTDALISTEIAIGEFNGDGIPDFAVVVFEKIANIILSTSATSYEVSLLQPIESRTDFEEGVYSPYPNSLVSGDFDNDGSMDIVMTSKQLRANSLGVAR
jgi:hypothetical protein